MRLERELEVQHHWIIGYSIAIPSFCVNYPFPGQEIATPYLCSDTPTKFKALMRLERELEVQHHWIIGYSIAIPSFCVNYPFAGQEIATP